jgi:hypothetical protein
MPIGDFECEVLRLIAANRNPDSFVGGATVLNQAAGTPRSSEDIDVFHDTQESLKLSIQADLGTLATAGFEAEMTVTTPTFARAWVRRGGRQTKVEWVSDSPFRFFPVEPDLELGWRLNFWDAATNKVLAFAGREAPRDYLDVLHLHRHHLSFGALVWAAAAKDPGLSPELIVQLARRNSKYRPEHFDGVRLSQPVDLRALKLAFLQAADEAEALFQKLPATEVGCFYLDASRRPVCPDPAAPGFAALTRHHGSIKGAWPRIAEDPS